MWLPISFVGMLVYSESLSDHRPNKLMKRQNNVFEFTRLSASICSNTTTDI